MYPVVPIEDIANLCHGRAFVFEKDIRNLRRGEHLLKMMAFSSGSWKRGVPWRFGLRHHEYIWGTCKALSKNAIVAVAQERERRDVRRYDEIEDARTRFFAVIACGMER